MRTDVEADVQPRPNGPHDSKCAFASPYAVILSRVHSFAFFMFGEPVSRGPTKSVIPSAISITFELRKRSWRMRVTTWRSGASAASEAARIKASMGGVV